MSLSSSSLRPELLSEAHELSASLKATLGASPLREVGERLSALLDGVSCAVENGHPPEQLRAAIAAARNISRLLPNSFGNRFQFDIWLITELREEWERAGAQLSRAMIPRYSGGGWGLSHVQMPSEDKQAAQVMRVLTFPGTDRLSDIDLSEYVWLFHELAHDSFYRSEHRFSDRFRAELAARVRSMRLRSAADTGVAARLASQRLEAFIAYWEPRPDQHDWAHEIASDVAAVWAAGPAFLTCFTRLLLSEPERALSAADQHPPYLTRALALVVAAERLGWGGEAWALEEEITIARGREGVDTSALVFSDPELIASAVDACLESCSALSIPRMTPERYSELGSIPDAVAAQLSGTALIVSGTIWQRRLDAAGYRAWLDSVFRD